MRDPERIGEILDTLEIIWFDNPDLRLGQLILNAIRNEQHLYEIEDEKLIALIEGAYNGRN